MSQTFVQNTYSADHIIETDCQNSETNFNTLQSNFSGTTTPSNPVEGQQYHNTHDDNPRCKVSGISGVSWYGVMVGADNTPLYMYVNSQPDSWAQVGGMGDRILAIKGGSQAYNASGGTNVGTWTMSFSTGSGGSHKHRYIHKTGDIDTATWNAAGTEIDIYDSRGNGSVNRGFYIISHSSNPVPGTDFYTETESSHTHGLASSSTWRPAAALGIMVRPCFTA